MIGNAGGIAFSPLLLSPSLWFRGDLGITIGTGVSAWADQSGNGNHVTQAVPTSQPAYDTAVNGVSVPRFDGSDDFLTRVGWSASGAAQPFTKYVVLTRTDTTNQGETFSLSAPGGNMHVRVAVAGNDVRAGYLGGNFLTLTNFGTTGHGNPMMFRSEFNGASSTLYGERTGVVTATASGNMAAIAHGPTIYVGNSLGASGFFKGCICELLVIPGILSAANDSAVRTYLRNKWGISPL